MKFGSVCSGIEAASAAWKPLGWEGSWFAEIEPFPCSLLAQHYPTVPNLGDITEESFIERARAAGPIDVLIGGTPCQSFSIAGLRGGLGDVRGNLALRFMQLVDELCPTFVVWENVPGVLSSNDGRDFGSILGSLVECGYGWAYRVLDAQYFGVAQRRRRVFVVGSLGNNWAAAAEILSIRESLQGHPAPSRETGEGLTGPLEQGPEGSGGPIIGDAVASTVTSHWAKGPSGGPGDECDNLIAHDPKAWTVNNSGGGWESEVYPPLDCTMGNEGMNQQSGITQPEKREYQGDRVILEDETWPTLPSQGANNGDGGGALFGFYSNVGTQEMNGIREGGPMPPLKASAVAAAAGFLPDQGSKAEGMGYEKEVSPTLRQSKTPGVEQNMAVRRLTPRECERLQGFPDDYTQVHHRGKPASDGPRYRALGNSMAVPVVQWIGRGIERIRALCDSVRPPTPGRAYRR